MNAVCSTGDLQFSTFSGSTQGVNIVITWAGSVAVGTTTSVEPLGFE